MLQTRARLRKCRRGAPPPPQQKPHSDGPIKRDHETLSYREQRLRRSHHASPTPAQAHLIAGIRKQKQSQKQRKENNVPNADMTVITINPNATAKTNLRNLRGLRGSAFVQPVSQ